MRTGDAIHEFMVSRGTCRPATLRGYAQHLGLFLKAFPAKLPTSSQPIQEWLNGFSHVKPATVVGRFTAIKAMYNQLCRTHPKTLNPIPGVRPPRLQPRAMRTFTDPEKYALFTLPLCDRDRAIMTLLLDNGIRRGECAALTWERVTPEYLTVGGKTGERMVPISPDTFRLLEALRPSYPDGGNRRVFEGMRGPLTPHGIYEMVHRRCRQAGITGKRASPHTFRATFATSYAAEDACDPQVLQRILGHKDFKTTLRYINASPRHILDNHRRCTPLRGMEALAQGRLIKDQEDAVLEAEGIVATKDHK